jgi:hypothetical protein
MFTQYEYIVRVFAGDHDTMHNLTDFVFLFPNGENRHVVNKHAILLFCSSFTVIFRAYCALLKEFSSPVVMLLIMTSICACFSQLF